MLCLAHMITCCTDNNNSNSSSSSSSSRNREVKQIATAGVDTAAGSKSPSKCADTVHVRRLHPAVARNLTTRVGMFCGSGYYVGFISLLWTCSTDISAF